MGFVGVGTMGVHMASSLLRAGVRLVVFDTNDAAVDRLSAMGASVSSSPAELAATPGAICITLWCWPCRHHPKYNLDTIEICICS